tara:strand:+ start:429 stop:650 length:222 start_codon:yes stop_codon:yes gene_type:complete
MLNSYLQKKCRIPAMSTICTASGQPIGTEINDGNRKPFQAPACCIRVVDYDESQMKEANHSRRDQQSELMYEC